MRPIDADTIFPNGQVLVWKKDGETTANYIIKLIKDAPTLDAEPVRHGRWKKRKSWDKYVCSECGFEHDEPHNYCPNPHCGAKMDAKEEKP